jgi:hypothetical protein
MTLPKKEKSNYDIRKMIISRTQPFFVKIDSEIVALAMLENAKPHLIMKTMPIWVYGS